MHEDYTCLMIAAIILAGAAVVGCGGLSSGGSSKQATAQPVASFDDGKKKYFSLQNSCPVCKNDVLKQKYSAQVDGNGYLYFDKEECRKKFTQNPQKHLENYRERMQKIRQQYGGGRR